MTTTTDQPTALPYDIEYSREDRDYACHVTIDERREYIGSKKSYGAAETHCREYLYDHYADTNTPEAAAQIAAAAFEPTAYDYGRAAFARGVRCAPAMDAAFLKTLNPVIGSNNAAYDEWLRGWTDANLAAPVDPSAPTRADLARAAFYGSNNALYAHLEQLDGYVENGVEWPSNGMSLSRAIELMESLTAEQIAELVALGIIGKEEADEPASEFYAAAQIQATPAAATYPPARRHVSAGWDRKTHPDLAVIAAQVLLPLAHLSPAISKSGDYLMINAWEEIAAPPDDHTIVCDLIDALNEVAAQLPARPDSITASLHIGSELYTVGHNGPPHQAPVVALDDPYLRALDGLAPWPAASSPAVPSHNWPGVLWFV